MNENIYVTRPSLPPLDEYVEYLKQIWDSRNLTNMGTFLREFGSELSDFLGVEKCLPLCNGHMSLELLLQAFELDGEVITTPFTFASTTHAIVRNGLTPVFCDVKEDDCTIDPARIEELITDKTAAIVPVHVYGMPCDVEEIDRIAKKHGLKVIYDAAHAFGEKIKGKGIASFGDASMFSFHATKCFNSIEGGCVALNNELLLRVYQLHNFGIMDEENVEFVGANAKMNELQAAMGLCNLRYFEDNKNKRKKLFDLYMDYLSEIDGISILNYKEETVDYNYSYLPVFIDEKKFGIGRDQVQELLKEKNIYTRKYFYPLVSDFNCYKNRLSKGNTPIAQKLSGQVLTLPLYSDLAESDVDRICNEIKQIRRSI
ncbi:DegT/DnrJ/EryC1/StrS family aminotransferase [Butyrivibrio sp. WCD3002]|uniref:DegT/DnrJ/EryC1/StrS family aminotransferase n=1 Tax=Butyrivibrio sp. WCD3002 TaxID=1280676 RepID=UPI00042966BA